MSFYKKFAIQLSLAIAVCSSWEGYAQNLKITQPSNFNITKLTTKEGLSSNTVNLVLKDKFGLMWFGTSNGLNKFDGTQLTVYRHNDRDKTSLPANEILALYEDSQGRLWIGTNGGELSYYDRDHDVFCRFPDEKSNDISSVRAISGDHLGNLWVSTYAGGIRVIDSKRSKITKRYFDGIKDDKPKANVVLCFFEDSKRRMWLGTNNGLYRYGWNKGTFSKYSHDEHDPASISNNIVKSITEDRSGKLWIATFGGINLLEPDGHSFQSFQHSANPQSLSNDIVYSVNSANDGRIWVGTDDGLNLFDTQSLTAVKLNPDHKYVSNISNNSIRSIFADKNGITWIGTLEGGIIKYDANLALFNQVQSNIFDPRGLTAPTVTAFAEYKRNLIFVGTSGGGLELFDSTTGIFKQYPITASKSKTNLSIISLKLDRNGILWVGTDKQGLFVINPATGVSHEVALGNPSPDVYKNNVACIEEDSIGNIWLGTRGNGVVVFDAKRTGFKRYITHPKGANEFELPLNGFVNAFCVSANGDVWVGSWGEGIAVFHPKTNKFSLYNQANQNLSANFILDIHSDDRNRIWIGTNGEGLIQFDYNTNKFVSYYENDGFNSGIIYKILNDASGMLWLSSDYGISSFDPAKKMFKNYNQDNGIESNPFVRGAGIITSANELFFGGLNGFNYFNPAAFPKSRYTPPIILTELRLTNNYAQDKQKTPTRRPIISTAELSLNYGQNFSISYAALNYTAAHQNQYLYTLVGFDKTWNEAGSSQTAYYTNLDPGDYTFMVKSSTGNGIWSDHPATIKINVLPPFWRTIYAYILYTFAFFGILYYIRRNGIRKIKMTFEIEQEKERSKLLLEQERREAERLHEVDLLKIKFLTNLSHEFRTPISLIVAPIDKMLSMNLDTGISGQVKVIRRNANRLLNLVNQLLDFRKLEEHESKLNPLTGDIISFISETTESFRELAGQKHILLSFESDVDHLQLHFDHEKVERIIFNLLSNAFKFTHLGGIISVKLNIIYNEKNKSRPDLQIQIADTGIGIPKEQQEKIFERFFQYENEKAVLNQGSGIGLSITREFVKLLDGNIQVKSSPGLGSTFTIAIPFDLPSANISEPIFIDRDYLEAGNAVQQGKGTPKVPILLVEDNEEFRFYLKDHLKSEYEIIEAVNGKDGWQRALADHPELIVCDISMPYMSGIELSKKIKNDKRTSHIPIIILTASSGENDQLKGLKTGANDYLTKPFNFDILSFKIKNLLLLNQTAKDTYSKQIQVLGPEITVESAESKLISTVVAYIEEKLHDPDLSVEDLSKYVNMSRGSLYNKILQLTGMTPVEYIRYTKLNKAATLLEKSDLNVAEIAYKTGFGTPSYFSRLFKAQFAMLPSEYVTLKRTGAKPGFFVTEIEK